MGLIATIFKHPRYVGCALGGISTHADEVCVVNAEGPFDPSPTQPAVILHSHGPGILRAVPAVKIGEVLGGVAPGATSEVLTLVPGAPKYAIGEGHYTMGGSYIGHSDSRFRELCDRLITESLKKSWLSVFQPEDAKWLIERMNIPHYGAVALHDRVERPQVCGKRVKMVGDAASPVTHCVLSAGHAGRCSVTAVRP